jgi:hypothetical protein
MYNESDMRTLRFIVDSLNLKYKSCSLYRTYFSNPRAKASYISFRSENDNLKSVIKDIKQGISPGELAKKYASLVESAADSLTIIKSGNAFYKANPGGGYEYAQISNDKSFNDGQIKDKWAMVYSEKGEYQDYYFLECHYFPGEWIKTPIPEEYARLIQYVDCMIDTTATVYLTDKYDYENTKSQPGTGLEQVIKYIKVKSGLDKRSTVLTGDMIEYAIKNLKQDQQFLTLLSTTLDNYLEKEMANAGLEALATQFALYDKALAMKRCYRIMGGCSMDTRPREHARDIAILAAQAHSWDIFLRAHLDIMNDRFARASDGSYAWAGRKTYLRELEELNLNIVDLMLGLSLRADNAAVNHYYGTIWRLGWALTESNERSTFEKRALGMIKDDRLDDYNRGLIFLLYSSYINHLGEKEAALKTNELKAGISTFPDFIQAIIRKMKEPAK